MKLSAYLVQNSLTAAAFAGRIGVAQSSVSRFISGTRRPDLGTLQRIHEATEGQVKAEDFFDIGAGAGAPSNRGAPA